MKKGFTLVELLAVIILIGVVIGIAVPTYASYTRKIREDSYRETLIGLIRSIELYVAEKPNSNFTTDTPISSLSLDAANINTIKSGSFNISSGEITLVDVTNGEHCGNGQKKNLTITVGDCTTAE